MADLEYETPSTDLTCFTMDHTQVIRDEGWLP